MNASRLIHHSNDVEMQQRLSPDDQIDGRSSIFDTDQLSRLVGENQQIISREIINGEHHIISRNQNGEHILTRIVNATDDHQLINKMDGSMYADHLPTPVLQYEKAESPELQGNQSKNGQQIVYAHPSDGKNAIMYGDPKATSQHYGGVMENGKPSELIYEDANKTVIYATSDPKANMDLYPSNELGLIDGTPVVVQGGIQYTQQPGPGGTIVYVLPETFEDDMNGQISR
jgi:transcription factor CP2-like protein